MSVLKGTFQLKTLWKKYTNTV